MARQTLVIVIMIAFSFLLGFTILIISPGESVGLGEAVAEDAEEDYERGPNGGRLLRNGAFALEVTIFEGGVPPQFHLYPYESDQPIDPVLVKTTVELSRLGGVIDRHDFTANEDHLVGSGIVYEPHSFEVTVSAQYNGQSWNWTYESFEGRTSIPDEVAEAAGVETDLVGATTIEELITLTGVTRIDPKRMVNLKPRFPGIVQSLRANIGEKVNRGDVLAVIESNESLRSYEVRSPIDGTIINRAVGVGEFVDSGDIFQVADLSTVIAELNAFPSQATQIRVGQSVRVSAAGGGIAGDGTIILLTPVADAGTQSIGAWVELVNKDMSWRPGMMVRGEAIVGTHEVELAVKNAGLQRFRDFTVVYAKVGNTYEVRMLDLGRADGTWTEVLGGIRPLEEYVSANSFLIKADVEKDGASHDH
ncbi:MAG: efflux RND transporter periplasmic adaptor subunit [Rhodospirillaceae bacterium]